MKKIFLILCIALPGSFIFAQVPKTLSFQGVLLEVADGQAANGTYTFNFKIYDDPSVGTLLWSETHNNVQVEDGVYNVLLGSEGTPVDLPFDQTYFLEIAVSGGPTSIPEETLSPRIELATSGYELNAHLQDLADGSLTGSKVGTGINAANVSTGTVAVTNGGTGASTASAARTNLGLAIGTNVQAYDADLSDLADGTLSDSKLETTIDRTGFNASDYITALGGIHVGGSSDPGTDNLIVDGTISGNGSGITNINGSNITTGTISDSRLEATINRTGFVASGDVSTGDDVLVGDDIFVSGEVLPGSSASKLWLKGTTLGPAISVDKDAFGMVNIANWGNSYMLNLDHALADNGVNHYFIRFAVNGSFVGGVYENGSGSMVYGAFTGVHMGATSDELDFGDLVVGDGTIHKSGSQIGSEPIYFLRKSQTANNPYVIGAYSDSQEDTWNSSTGKNMVSIMSVGNGFVWVADNGEDLKMGDYLISSGIPGHAMKDNGEYDIAYIIARVGEDVIWSEVTETVNGIKHKRINVFFENFIQNHKADRLEVEIEEMKRELAEIKALLNPVN